MDHHNSNGGNGNGTEPRVTIGLLPERQLIRPSESRRHVAFTIGVERAATPRKNERVPLRLALVLDRSGSMEGVKLTTAKRAALAVLDQLEERDRAAVVAFDDAIDVLQPLAPVNAQTKRTVKEAFQRLEARGTTALHEGWLTGCRAIASDSPLALSDSTARCFLLTDGLANRGLADPEQIASEAAAVRERAGVSTSTFGVGLDYNEALLVPMAVAGGGQFHNLRTAADIADTFLGEVSDLLAVAVRQVRLELSGANDITTEVVSAYWAGSTSQDGRISIAIGDLLAGDERQVVVRFGFPNKNQGTCSIRARVVWQSASGEHSTDWQEITFQYASHAACDGERRDPAAMHWVGLHHSERAKLEAAKLNTRGDVEGARKFLRYVAQHIATYAQGDADLQMALRELWELDRQIAERRLDNMASKELSFQAVRHSRAQKDHRRPS